MTTTQDTRFEDGWNRTSGPVHGFFGLSYANYYVAPRTLMQCMPLEWQRRFAELAGELDAAYPDRSAEYEVTTVRWEYVSELPEDEMKMLGITTNDDDEDEDEDYDPGQDYRERVYYLKDGTEVPDIHRVPIPVPDTLPHYKHSYLPPDEAGIAAHRAFRAEYPLESP